MASKRNLLFVAGARPNFMKIAPLIRECEARQESFEYLLVHTGQHYDSAMSDVFFAELGIPKPTYNLGASGGNDSQRTADIMGKFHDVCEQESPDCVVVVGDVNSTLACSVVAKKLLIKVAHIEAGLRSGDRTMPEEINRLVTDSISDYFFVTEPSGVTNLRKEGHSKDKIFFVGHVMIDNLYHEYAKSQNIESPLTKDISAGYGVVTLHRPSNVDDRDVLSGLVQALETIAEQIPLFFPVHPRTKRRLEEFDLCFSNSIRVIEPLGYRDFLNLWKNARLVLTDSGGLQEETTALGVPCLTLRTTTERPITVDLGSNVLVGTHPEEIVKAAEEALDRARRGGRPELWDGKASSRIFDVLENELLP